jgi:hypothetical protein
MPGQRPWVEPRKTKGVEFSRAGLEAGCTKKTLNGLKLIPLEYASLRLKKNDQSILKDGGNDRGLAGLCKDVELGSLL